jgi:AIR synthase-related protein
MLAELAECVRTSKGLAHKRDLEPLLATLATVLPQAQREFRLGDDCAVIADGADHLLFAAEGFLNEFVATQPWFAGYCGVMVNVSDVYAMGGRPIAVVDALWSRDLTHASPVLAGLAAAAQVYQVPIVGGHSNARSDREQLAVAILGRAQKLLTSFDAQAQDVLMIALDLRGRYREPYPYWDASTDCDSQRLRDDLALLPGLAQDGLCRAAKDISMAGILGTALMLLECSALGAVIDIRRIPSPPAVAPLRWLVSTFPSYGFLLSVTPSHAAEVQRRFAARGLACTVIGHCDGTHAVRLTDGAHEELIWDFGTSPLMGCQPRTSPP